jgi:UV DNA damage endonuclease
MTDRILIVNEDDDIRKGNIRLGLCCINNSLRPKGIFCYRTMVRRNFTPEKAKEYTLKNINDVSKILAWNDSNNIFSYRLSSDMYPHFTDPETEPYTMDFSNDMLDKVGTLSRNYGHRITMHPGQYNQIGTPTASVFEKTVKDLTLHANILDKMGLDDDSICNIHGGGVYGDKENTIRRWVDQFDELPRNVKNRLTIENCEKCYSVRDCIKIAEETKIPVVFDTHHYSCYNILHPTESPEEVTQDLLGEIVDTWRGRRPLFHISEQKPNARIGAHSDYIEEIPEYLLELAYTTCFDIDVEAKAKEDAILHLHSKYNTLFF